MPRAIPSLAAAMVTAGLLGLVAAPVSAQDKGPYIEGTAGISLPEDSEVSAGGVSTDVSLDNGFAGGLAVGNAYGNGFRTEFEIGFHSNDLDRSPSTSINGDTQAISLMVNGLYDFAVDSRFKPFVGVGLGGARVSVDADTYPNVLGAVDDSDIGFAWQGMAGVAYQIDDQLSASLRYRYFSVPSVNMSTSGGSTFETDYASHDIMVGLRWSFGAPKKMEPKPEPVKMAPPPPPPPPPAAPPPPPPLTRNFIVFFDFDSATLTPQARSIISAAANESRKRSGIRIALTGHTDRAGRTSYNQRLSMRRAVAVRDELIRLGLANNDIGVSAKGESEPLVSTADGVREAQNRRVEIVLQ